MNNLPINLMISLLLMISIIAIIVFIQVKLSRRENKYLGLILPVLSFLFSLMTVLGMVSFITLIPGTPNYEKAKNHHKALI